MLNLFNFKGKIGRLEFFITTITIIIIFLMQSVLYSLIPENHYNNIPLVIITFIFLLIAIWINFAAASKRFQDIGLSGWRCLLLLIPIVKFVVYIYLCSVPSQKPVPLNTNVSGNIPKLNNTFIEEQNNDNTFVITIGVMILLFLGMILLILSIGNKMKQLSENTETSVKNQRISSKPITTNNQIMEKTLFDYYNEGSEFCSHFKFDGNDSWYYCTIEYIENNANYEINKQFKSIQKNCEISTTNNADYKNCVYRVVEEVSR